MLEMSFISDPTLRAHVAACLPHHDRLCLTTTSAHVLRDFNRLQVVKDYLKEKIEDLREILRYQWERLRDEQALRRYWERRAAIMEE